jgi:hypothetical protein
LWCMQDLLFFSFSLSSFIRVGICLFRWARKEQKNLCIQEEKCLQKLEEFFFFFSWIKSESNAVQACCNKERECSPTVIPRVCKMQYLYSQWFGFFFSLVPRESNSSSLLH